MRLFARITFCGYPLPCRVLVGFVYVVSLYFISYFVLMNRTVVAVNEDTGKISYASSFRFSPSVQTDGDLSIYAPSDCWLNVVFYPLDILTGNTLDEINEGEKNIRDEK